MILNLIEEHFPSFLNTFTSYDLPIKRHDSARIAILYVFGGIYLDHDFIAVKNIEPALGSCEFVLGNEEAQLRPVNGFMAIIENSPLMKMIIQMMNNEDVASKSALDATGPHLLLNGLKKYFETGQKIFLKIFSKNFFYPTHWSNKEKIETSKISEIYPECFFYQLYDASWLN